MGGAAAQTSLDLSELLRGYHASAGQLFPAWHGSVSLWPEEEKLCRQQGVFSVFVVVLFVFNESKKMGTS